jgi:hypothetical protein
MRNGCLTIFCDIFASRNLQNIKEKTPATFKADDLNLIALVEGTS